MKTKTAFFFFLSFCIFLVSCQNPNTSSVVLDPKKFQQEILEVSNAKVLDVRTPNEFSSGHIAKAININLNDNTFSEKLDKLNKEEAWFVYCLSGGRSEQAAELMRTKGFKNVYELKGGILAWQKENLLLENANNVADEFSRTDYDALVSSGLVLVDFYATWCGPCKKMEPMLADLEKVYNGKMKLLRIDVDKNKDLTNQLGFTEIPVLKIYANGNPVWEARGLVQKETITRELEPFVK
jgi:thioredoxin 1